MSTGEVLSLFLVVVMLVGLSGVGGGIFYGTGRAGGFVLGAMLACVAIPTLLGKL